MAKINVLSKNISELIAAGEVIERPASIVKELLENAVDAGATAVTVEIRRGGISYIRITDNGSGMEKEDVPTAFLRHATSKIKESDDLDHIATLGFRGEALASIAAVSKVELTSKTMQAQFGARITLESGEQLDFDEVGCATGTTIIIRDLFYNVPARLKFLKKDVSEGNAISGILDKIALSHPEISFKLINENKIKIHTPGNNDLVATVHAIFGKEFAAALIPVNYELNGITVTGYVSATSASRTNRAMQHFFVNARYVKSKTCMVALEEGYKNALMVGKYPFCVMNVTLPFDTVDVNVHPAKIEVRFVNERLIFDAIYFAVKSALAQDDILKNEVSPIIKGTQIKNLLSTFKSEEAEQVNIDILPKNRPESTEKQNAFTGYHDTFTATKPQLSSVRSPEKAYQTSPQELLDSPVQEMSFSHIQPPLPTQAADNFIVNQKTGEVIEIHLEEEPIVQEVAPIKAAPYFRIIGELFQTYVLFEVEDRFLLLDKHAAHERILFEKLKLSVSTEDRQVLLKPVVIAVSSEELQALNDKRELVEKLGFSFDEFGNRSIIIREAPLLLIQYNIADIFLDIAQKLMDNKRDTTSDICENLLHSMACRSAIKANDTTDMTELIALLKQVYANDEIRHCPHGRPIVIAMGKNEIEKKFGRIT